MAKWKAGLPSWSAKEDEAKAGGEQWNLRGWRFSKRQGVHHFGSLIVEEFKEYR